jgi:hypothetical protein
MKYLIERGLMFSDLIEVASPVLVERYNPRAEASHRQDHSAHGFPYRHILLLAGKSGRNWVTRSTSIMRA